MPPSSRARSSVLRHTCRPHLIVASDLHTKHPAIKMPKYADEMYLMFDSNNLDPISEEFANIRSWATLNNLRIHPNKTKYTSGSRTSETGGQILAEIFERRSF